MKGIERLIEMCMNEWPDVPLTFTVYPKADGSYRLQVYIDRYLTPGDFSDRDLTQPQAVMHSLRMMMAQRDEWLPRPPAQQQPPPAA